MADSVHLQQSESKTNGIKRKQKVKAESIAWYLIAFEFFERVYENLGDYYD